MMASVLDANYTVLGSARKSTNGSDGVAKGRNKIVKAIQEAIVEAGVDPKGLQGIGIGCPGPLNLEEGVILELPNLGWKNVPLKRLLEKEFGCPAFVCNDVDSGMYGEFQFGAAQGARTAIGLFPGTGIGGAMIFEGKIFRGKTGSCLEIGHVPVMADGPFCGCGQRGCLETVASRLAMAAYRGQAPYILRVAGTDLANIRSGTIKEAIDAGDKIVEAIIRDGARQLGVVLAGTVNLLAPDVIVLGGGLVEALPKLFLEEVGKAIAARIMPSYLKTYELRVASLGDDSGAMGAAAWARHCVGG